MYKETVKTYGKHPSLKQLYQQHLLYKIQSKQNESLERKFQQSPKYASQFAAGISIPRDCLALTTGTGAPSLAAQYL